MLVAAGGHENVNDAVVAAARELVGQTAKVRLVLWDEDGARVAASSGGGAWELPQDAADQLRRAALASAPVEVLTLQSSVLARARAGRGRRRAPRPPGRARGRAGGPCVRLPAADVEGPLRLARGARFAGVAGARRRIACREPPPPEERGPLPFARRPLERPDHGARQRPASSRIRARRSSVCSGTRSTRSRARASTGSSRQADRARLTQVVAGADEHGRRDAYLRVLAAPSGRTLAPVRGAAHATAGGRAHPRDRPEQPRRQRAEGVRGAARPSGLPRPGHQSGQPRSLRRPRAARSPFDRADGVADLRDVRRPGRLQDRQRQSRASRGRRDSQGGRRAARGRRSPGRHRRAVRRRRVRHPARRRRGLGRGGNGRRTAADKRSRSRPRSTGSRSIRGPASASA